MADNPNKKREMRGKAHLEDFDIKADGTGVISFVGLDSLKTAATDLGASVITVTSGYSGVFGASSGYTGMYGPLGRFLVPHAGDLLSGTNELTC